MTRPPASLIPQAFKYDPDTGSLSWLKKTRHTDIGDEAGSVTRRGQVIVTLHGAKLPAEEVCWVLMHGTWPTLPIRFRNSDRQDLRWQNLYEYTGLTKSDTPKAIAMRELRERQKRQALEARTEAAQREAAELVAQYPNIAWSHRSQAFVVSEPYTLPFSPPVAPPKNRRIGYTDTFEEGVMLYEDHLQRLDLICQPRAPLPDHVLDLTPGARGYYAVTMRELHAMLHYDQDTGEFIWRGPSGLVGLRADHPVTPSVAISPRYISVRGRRLFGHMLAWFMTYHQWPRPKSILWHDENPSNNAIHNLYLRSEND